MASSARPTARVRPTAGRRIVSISLTAVRWIGPARMIFMKTPDCLRSCQPERPARAVPAAREPLLQTAYHGYIPFAAFLAQRIAVESETLLCTYLIAARGLPG